MHTALPRPPEPRDRSGRAAGTRPSVRFAPGSRRGESASSRSREEKRRKRPGPWATPCLPSEGGAWKGGLEKAKGIPEQSGSAGGRLGCVRDADRTAGRRGTGGDDDDVDGWGRGRAQAQRRRGNGMGKGSSSTY